MFKGRVWQEDKFWLIEVPELGVMTQGFSKDEAFDMIADVIEGFVNKPGFKVKVYPGSDGEFEVDSEDVDLLFELKKRRGHL